MFLLWLTHLPAWGCVKSRKSARLFSPAMNALGQQRKWVTYSITWSASNWSELGTVRPRAAAVLRLMTSSYLSGS